MSEKPLVGLPLCKPAHVTTDVARCAVGKLQCDGDFLADNILKRNGIIIVRQQVQFIGEQPRDSFVPGQFLQQQHVLAQRSVEGNEPVILGVAFIWHEAVLLPFVVAARFSVVMLRCANRRCLTSGFATADF